MIEREKLTDGALVEHLRKGDQYTVIALGKMEECPGYWIPSITFRKNQTGEVFTRALERFVSKFKIVT